MLPEREACMVIQAAEAIDLPAVRRLLETQHLPLDGVDEQWNCMRTARSCDRSSSIHWFKVKGLASA